jgi:protein-tyrosine-phosphatase
VRILFVCTANICRSASAAHLLRAAVPGAPALAGIEVRSAGTAALAGSPGCSVAPALVGHAAEHRSQSLTADLVAWADLILPAARDHRPVILALDPRSRTRTLTIRQAGRIADWIVDSGMVAAARERSAGGLGEGTSGAGADVWAARFPEGDPRRSVEALPGDLERRWLWLVSEMDAARGLSGVPGQGVTGADAIEPARRFRPGRAGRATGRGEASVPGARDSSEPTGGRGGALNPDPYEVHPDDVPDPHVLGMGLHPLAYEQLASSTGALVRLLREVAPGS